MNSERLQTFRRPGASAVQLTKNISTLVFQNDGGTSRRAYSLRKLAAQGIFAAALAAVATGIQTFFGSGDATTAIPFATLFLIGSTSSRTNSREGASKPDSKNERFVEVSSNGGGNGSIERDCINWQLFARLSIPGENTAFTLHDGKGTLIDATDAATDLWRLSKESLIGASLEKLFHSPKAVHAWFIDLEKDSNGALSTNILTAEGFESSALLKRIPLFISGDPSKTRVILKTILATPDRSNSARPAPCSVHSINSAFESSNTAWSDLIGYNARELRDHPLSEFVIAEDVELAKSLFKKAVDSDRPIRSLLRLKAKDGSIRTMMTSVESKADSPSLSLAGKEITLRDGNADLLASSIELIQEGVVILAREKDGFRIRHVNQAFENKTGYKTADAKGATISKFTGPKTNARGLEDFEKAVIHEAQHECELILYRKNGDPFWTKTSMYPLRNDKGIATHCIIVIEDISEIRAVVEELAQKNIELEKVVANLKQTQKTVVRQENLRALGQMASGIAHDFNNLLAPILGFSELLLNTPASARDNAKLESFLKKIQTAAQDGAAVVSRLREFYRSQNNDEDLTLIQLPALIDQVKELTRHRWKNQAEAQGVSIDFITDVSTRHKIMANEPELRQVLTNLIINAVDATKGSGSITVRVFDERKRVRIDVIDTGMGMPAEVRKNCLEPFYTTKGKLGTGLGLSIVYGVVERLNGRFDIDSKEGFGTTIRMSFPIARTNDQDEKADRCGDTQKALKIMLVDDEEVLLEVVSELLTTSGHQVSQFSDPHQALETFETEDYDLVITDRAMPKMSGDQLAKKIREIDPETKIFMLTGFGDLIKETGTVPDNVDEVLSKPVPLDLLQRKLSKLSGNRN